MFSPASSKGIVVAGQTLQRIAARHLSLSSRIIDLNAIPANSVSKEPDRVKNASKNSRVKAIAFDFDGLFKTIHKEHEELKNRKKGEQDHKETKGNPNSKKNILSDNIPDKRVKYAKKLGCGVANLDLTKTMAMESLARGDAAAHFAAKKMVCAQDNPALTKGWMSVTPVGKLLSYLTKRDVKIGLLPDPKKTKEDPKMDNIEKELPNVIFDTKIQSKQFQTVDTTFQKLLDDLKMEPESIMVVSDRCEYLSAANELGMLTCRVRNPNEPCIETTAYNVEEMAKVREVVDELNGVSFHAMMAA